MTSARAIARTLSPVTVQKRSSPSASYPVMLQLPPTTASGCWLCVPTLPHTIAFTPSGTSLKKTSRFSSTSYAITSVFVPTRRISRPIFGSSRPLATAVMFLLMFRYRTLGVSCSSRLL